MLIEPVFGRQKRVFVLTFTSEGEEAVRYSITPTKNGNADSLSDLEYVLVSDIPFHVAVQVNNCAKRESSLKAFSHFSFCNPVKEIAVDDVSKDCDGILSADQLTKTDKFPFLSVEIDLAPSRPSFHELSSLMSHSGSEIDAEYGGFPMTTVNCCRRLMALTA